jgi:small subunit ribosomal protein S17
VVEEERKRTPETEEPAEEPAAEPVAETPQDLVVEAGEAGETVEAGLDASPSKGPALDQDEGQIQTDTERNRRKERVGLIVSDKARKRWRLANVISRAE